MEERASSRRIETGTLLSVLLLALPIVLLAVGAWRQRWMSDDGLINVRVVQQIIAGNGPVYNQGERVEVVTSPLWVWLLAFARAITFDHVRIEWLAVIGGITLSLVGLGTAQLGAAGLVVQRTPRAILVPFGSLVVAVLAPFWDFASSGLETGLTMAWLGTCYLAIARHNVRAGDGGRADVLRPMWWPMLIGLGPLIRPDLTLFTIAFLVAWQAASVGTWRARTLSVGIGLAPAIAYQVFRMGYYGATVPNTAIAKEAGAANWDQGWFFLTDFVRPYALAVPLLAAMLAAVPLARSALAGDGPPDWRLAVIRGAPVAAGAASVLFVVRVGGDFMHARMLLPATFAVLMPVSVIPVSVSRVRTGVRALDAVRLAGVTLMVAWSMVAVFSPRMPAPDDVYANRGIVDERLFWTTMANRSNPVIIEDFSDVILYSYGSGANQADSLGEDVMFLDFFRARPTPKGTGVVIATANLGIVGVRAGIDVRVADGLGLGNAISSRIEAPATRGRPGHDKISPDAYLVAQYAEPAADDPPEEVAARAALACGKLVEVREATTEPMGPSRFVQNIIAAPSLTAVRLPLAPEAAEARFCK